MLRAGANAGEGVGNFPSPRKTPRTQASPSLNSRKNSRKPAFSMRHSCCPLEGDNVSSTGREASYEKTSLRSHTVRRRACHRGGSHRRLGGGANPADDREGQDHDRRHLQRSRLHRHDRRRQGDARAVREQRRGRHVLGRGAETRRARGVRSGDHGRHAEVGQRRPRQEHVQGAENERARAHHLQLEADGRGTGRAEGDRDAADRRRRARGDAPTQDHAQGRHAGGQRRDRRPDPRPQSPPKPRRKTPRPRPTCRPS